MASPELLARLVDPDGDTLFDCLGDWPAWLPSLLAWVVVGFVVLALALTAVTPSA